MCAVTVGQILSRTVLRLLTSKTMPPQNTGPMLNCFARPQSWLITSIASDCQRTIALLLPQGPEVLIAHFAAYRIGAIILPLFTLFGPDALAYRCVQWRKADHNGCRHTQISANLPNLPELEQICLRGR